MSERHTARTVERADHRLTSMVNDKSDSWPMRVIGAASEIGDQPQMRMLCGATVMLGLARRDRHLAATGLRMLAAHTLATWGKTRIKHAIDRTRPDSGEDPRVRPGDSDRHEDNSFPSGHSAGAVAVGEAFARAFPDQRLAARCAALSVSAVQVPRGTHYVGDVAAGIAIGIVAERACHAGLTLADQWVARLRPAHIERASARALQSAGTAQTLVLLTDCTAGQEELHDKTKR